MPHGRTIGLPAPALMQNENLTSLLKNLVPYWDDKQLNVTNYATILMSHCLQYMMGLIKELKKYNVFVDLLGKCGSNNNSRR